MAGFVVRLLLVFSIAGHSVANYCVCNSGVSDSGLQKNIDYSCANGADCSAIQQNGACYNPNTVKSHCDYAVNSYFQRKQQSQGSCDFQGTATVTPSPPSTASGCIFQSGTSTGGGGTTPTTSTMTPPTTGTPATGGAPPNTSNGTTTTAPGTTVPPGTGSFTPPGFSLAPTGSGLGSPEDNGGVELLPLSTSTTFVLVVLFTFSMLVI